MRIWSSLQVQNAGEGIGGALLGKVATFSRRSWGLKSVFSGMYAVGTARRALRLYF